MSSMRELYPTQAYRQKPKKNFIKENIKNVKGCSQCSKERKLLNPCSKQLKAEGFNMNIHSNAPKDSENTTSIKCNLRIKRKQNSSNDLRESCASNVESRIETNSKCIQTDLIDNEYEKDILVNCQSCGQAINRKTIAMQTSFNNNEESTEENEIDFPIEEKRCERRNEDHEKRKDRNKMTNISNHKIGVVPRYLKERNLKLEQERKEQVERERLAELQGLNDPRCPPGHMLMPADELAERLSQLNKEYDSLIRELNMMPVSSDSYRVRQRKIQIERDLKKLEVDIDLYKSGKVFIKLPE